jgi:hypothetical protein
MNRILRYAVSLATDDRRTIRRELRATDHSDHLSSEIRVDVGSPARVPAVPSSRVELNPVQAECTQMGESANL